MTILSQNTACPEIVQTALDQVQDLCVNAGRNQACYGNIALTAQPKEGVSDFVFESQGDIVNVADIASMNLQPLNETEDAWGVVLMRLQANIPDTLPGQNVTFLLFGDVSIEPNPNIADANPMQAFYLRTGIGDSACAEAPSSGVIVQTPAGVKEVAFNVNGVDVSMGSTILFRAIPGEEMTVSALEGAAVLDFDGDLFPVVAGTWARMAYDEDGVLMRPALPTAYRSEVLSALPLRLLDRAIEAREPLSVEQLDVLYERLNNGEPPCGDGEGLFPLCDNLPFFNQILEGRDFHWANEEGWQEELPQRFNVGGQLVDVVREGDLTLLQNDEGILCIIGDAPQGDERPSCKKLLQGRDLQRIENAFGLGQTPLPDFIQSVEDGVITLTDGRTCARRLAAADSDVPACHDILTPEEIQQLRDIDESNFSGQPADDRTCVYPPGPNDAPLPADEIRPICDAVVPGQNFPPGHSDTSDPNLPPIDPNLLPPVDPNQLPPVDPNLPPPTP